LAAFDTTSIAHAGPCKISERSYEKMSAIISKRLHLLNYFAILENEQNEQSIENN
jgi:hypothetical protein